MKSRTTITLSPETLAAVDRVAGETGNRSRVIEQAISEYIARLQREAREARDLEILDRAASELNREMEEILSFQVDP